MTTEEKLERALDLLAQTTTTLRDLYLGYSPRECSPSPAQCVTENKEFFASLGELDRETREVWTVE